MKYIYSTFLVSILNISNLFAGEILPVKTGLPGSSANTENVASNILANFITASIKYVAIIAVLALMVAGIMYMIAGGEEEKTKKAKKWIIWALVGVLLSVSALGIINLVNNITI